MSLMGPPFLCHWPLRHIPPLLHHRNRRRRHLPCCSAAPAVTHPGYENPINPFCKIDLSSLKYSKKIKKKKRCPTVYQTCLALNPFPPKQFFSLLILILCIQDFPRFFCQKLAQSMADEGWNNFDNLQIQHKQQPKKRSVPVAPIGLCDRFPTARTIQQMMETMERMMEDPFAYSGGWPSPLPPTDNVGYSRGRRHGISRKLKQSTK